MVKFKKLLGKGKIPKLINPIDIFDNLDKEVGKESLRDSQKAVLKEWYSKYQSQKDIIIKLHTGQGKTLIGLLILQSSLNEGKGPALYLCPNNYLVDQIMRESRAFGIKTIKFSETVTYPPREFLNSEAILVANCKKLFNGRSQFGVRGIKEIITVGAIVIDDAHTCLDLIREQFSIKIKKENGGVNNPIYEQLWDLFKASLNEQGPGTFSDLLNGEITSLMAVPFWTWFDKRDDVLRILSEKKDSKELLFVWDLLKDILSECVCLFSGDRLEITPRLLPVDLISSYSNAERRIFLSATLTEDAFLVNDMSITPESVTNPLSSGDVEYSGERLILLPSLVDPTLERKVVISWIQTLAEKNGTFGVVAITPSFNQADAWGSGGALVTRVGSIYASIDGLKAQISTGNANNVLVLVNEYDGVDLPDTTCRILVLDSLPSYRTLMDRYLEEMRPNAGIIRRKRAQRVEQGMGRAIRGSSDWCIVVITGNKITNFLSDKSKRAFLSKEAQLQIEIGDKLAQEMKEEGGQLPVITELINQCLRRDEGWKQYYKEEMSTLEQDVPQKEHLTRAMAERTAELLSRQRQYKQAAETIQKILDESDPNDKGWLQQLRATYLYPIDQGSSMDIQVKAHSENISLFRPPTGITYTKMTATGTRESRIFDWIKKRGEYNVAIMELKEIMSNLLWSSSYNKFEHGINKLGETLGFIPERPEKECGVGPDNLWHIQGKKYWLIECKNQVQVDRTEISKSEAGQLLNSIGWFKETHETDEGLPIIIHPAHQLASDAFVTDAFWVIGREELKKIRECTLKFYNSLTSTKFDDLSPEIIRQKLIEHSLDTNDLVKEYLKRGE